MAGVEEVTDETFERDVLEAGRPVAVDFWAPWCGPCRAIGPIMEALAADYGEHVGFVKLNIDESPATGARYNVLSIPTVMLFAVGEPQSSIVGARAQAHYENAWAAWLHPTP